MFQRSALPLCAALVWLAGAATAVAAPDPQEPPAAAAPAVLAVAVFPVPPEIRPAVAFWTEVYARYTSQQTVLHDNERLDVVYGVLDFSELSRTPMNEWQRARTRTNAEELEKERIRNLLREIALYADRPERLTPEQRRIFELFPEEPGFRVTGARFLEAADRVRGQVGQRDRFMEGIRTSGRYLPEIERIFQQEGVPIELSRLAFVESMFNLNARSAVGASGVWQFMRSTGRLYLRVDDLVDERNDPLLAARAAARLLADNHDDLKSWPLAVTAYNHGKYGMLRAVAETGSREIGRIVTEYRGPAFGFASRNFYAEFLAALHVERNARRYFGAVPVEPPPPYDLVAMPGNVGVADLARRARLEIDEVRSLNPALTDRALRTNRPLPRGYALRVPSDRRPRLVAARFSVRPGWRPGVTVAAAVATDVVSAGRPAVAPTSGPLAALHADHRERLHVVTPEPPRLDPELYRAQLMAAEEEALGLFLTAAVDDQPAENTGVPATPPGSAGSQGTQASAAPEAGTDPLDRAAPPEASGDRLVGAAVEALEASQPQPPAEMPAAEPTERVVRPGSRVVPSVTTPAPTFRTTVRGGETAWRLAEWSEESLEAFCARNRLAPDQAFPVGRSVNVSTARVPREVFEARRAAFHEALRDKAAREFTVTGTRPHRLEPGQTPWRIAETNRVPFWLLEQTNPDRDLSALKAGDTLLVPILKK